MANGSFKGYMEPRIGKVPYFILYVLLEWTLIFILFVDGLIAFVANEFARGFDLKMPCLLCTRLDHILVHRDPDFYYNDSICESHRKDVSSLAYCHIHQKLSDIRQMCEGCLLSFATENQSNCETYKSLVGVLGGDSVTSTVQENHQVQLIVPSRGEEQVKVEKCSCCHEPLRTRTSFQQALAQIQASSDGSVPQAPAPSPRGLVLSKNEESRSTDPMSQIRYTDMKFVSDTESELQWDEDGSTVMSNGFHVAGREDTKTIPTPLLTENEDGNEESCKTPSFIRAHRFFGFTDSATASPRGGRFFARRLLADKGELSTEALETNTTGEPADDEAILKRLKTQVRLDRKSLIALYIELDEERSASAVAANQAMAMITRLQAEKAAVQMEALQYQRMMEEQAEYDQEALQVVKDLLAKRDEEVRVLEEEVKILRHKLGCEEQFDMEGCDTDYEKDYQKHKFRSTSNISQLSECGSPPINLCEDEFKSGLAQNGPLPVENGWAMVEEDPLHDQESERLYVLERLRMLEKIHMATKNDDHPEMDNLKEECREDGNQTSLSREISYLTERLEAIENDRDILKQAFHSLQKGNEGTQLLREIAQRLREIRHVDKVKA